MTATEVLNRLDKLGVTAWPNSGNIRFQPASRVPPAKPRATSKKMNNGTYPLITL